MTSFKYLGALFTSDGGSQADVNNRIRIGWMKWKEVSGVICDRKMAVALKDKVFKTVIRPPMSYDTECWTMERKMRANEGRKGACKKPVETFLENKD